MTDWKAMARAAGLPLSDEEMARTLAPLELLDPLLVRLAERTAAETDPAMVFDAGGVES